MENWLIVLGIIALFFFLMRRGGAGMGCCGGGHSHGGPSEDPARETRQNPEQLGVKKQTKL
jgi:hypothetical protein